MYEAIVLAETGVQLLFAIKTDRKGNRLPAEQVTDPETIMTFDGNDAYLRHAEADNKVIKTCSTEHLASRLITLTHSSMFVEKQPPKTFLRQAAQTKGEYAQRR